MWLEMFRGRKKSELRLQRRAKWTYPGIYSPKWKKIMTDPLHGAPVELPET